MGEGYWEEQSRGREGFESDLIILIDTVYQSYNKMCCLISGKPGHHVCKTNVADGSGVNTCQGI